MDRYIAEFTKWFKTQNKRTLVGIVIVLVILIGVIGYFSGPYISTSIFYLLPIGIAAWGINKRFALLISFVCAFIWLLTDIATNPVLTNSLSLVPYWNAAVRLGFFLVVTVSLASLHEAKKRQEEMLPFIVHDLRSPLSNILMSLTFLKETNLVEPPVESMINNSISSSQKMLIQVNSLLDLSQLENKKLKIVRSDTHVGHMVNQAVTQVSFLAAQKNIEIEIEMISEHLLVWADEDLSVRVFVNLLSNSIKFSPNHCLVVIKICQENEHIRFCVCDNGPGIPLAWQKQVFHKYEQVQTGKSNLTMGSGLGLAFCKTAIEAQNGRIWLDDHQNQNGVIICFTLPASSLLAEKL